MSELERWLDMQLPEIKDNLEIVDGDVQFLHISQKSPLKSLRPWIGRRQGVTEDRTIPRICGSGTIKGCIYGYSGLLTSILESEAFNGTNVTENHTGIFYIYRCNVDGIVKPTKKLVYDAEITGEIWIVGYSPDTLEVTPENVGTILPVSTTVTKELGIENIVTKFYVECKTTLRLDDDNLLNKGFYAFTLKGPMWSSGKKSDVSKTFDLQAIKASEYREAIKTARANHKKLSKKK